MAFREKYGFTKTLRKNLRVLRLQLRRRREINDSCAFLKMVQYLQNRVLWTTRKMSKPIYKVLKIPGVVANTKDVGTTGSMVSHFNDFMAAAESLEFDSCWQKRNRSWVLCYFSDFLGSIVRVAKSPVLIYHIIKLVGAFFCICQCHFGN